VAAIDADADADADADTDTDTDADAYADADADADGRVATRQIPDDVVFVDRLPPTAAGKLLKSELRASYRNHRLAGA
jgi:acyl-CoA synthetase (AMP-forming)/AMP-acid ligase II